MEKVNTITHTVHTLFVGILLENEPVIVWLSKKKSGFSKLFSKSRSKDYYLYWDTARATLDFRLCFSKQCLIVYMGPPHHPIPPHNPPIAWSDHQMVWC